MAGAGITSCASIFNVILVLVGGAMLGFGIWILAFPDSLRMLLTFIDADVIQKVSGMNAVKFVCWTLIAVGTLVLAISCVGYCATLSESTVLLQSYCVFLSVILVMGLTLVISVGVNKTGIQSRAGEVLRLGVKIRYSTPEHSNPFTNMFNKAMIREHCCGADGYEDFKDAREFLKYSKRSIPSACCKNQTDEACIVWNPNPGSFFTNGCIEPLTRVISRLTTIGIIAGSVWVAVTLIGLLLVARIIKDVGDYRRIH